MQRRESPADAIRRLFESHGQAIYRYALFSLGSVADAEDVTQDVFVSALRSFNTFEGRATEATWLWVIARRRVFDAANRRKRDAMPMADIGEIAADGLDMTAHLDLLAALDELPPVQKEVFLLRIVEDLSGEETSRITGLSHIGVRVTLHRATKKLEALLGHPEPKTGGA